MRVLMTSGLVAALALAAACGRAVPPGTRPTIAVGMVSDQLSPYVIEVRGFADADLSRVRGASLSVERMQAALRVTPEGAPAGTPPVAGRYSIADDVLRFSSLYPLAMGHDYDVVFDPSVIAGMSFSGTVRATVTIR
jgi:hypothetical protein